MPSRIKMTHTSTQVMMSFVAGLMLGVACYHLLPHAIYSMPGSASIDHAVWWLMIGLLSMFVLLRAFHFHQHSPIEEDGETLHLCDGSGHAESVANDSHTSHSHTSHSHTHSAPSVQGMSWAGVFFGLAIHTVIDGIALGAAIEAEALSAAPVGLVGFGVFVAIVLHKPLDSMSIASLMIAGGWSARARIWVNIVFSLMCPLGALLFVGGIQDMGDDKAWIVGATLAFSAGVFICISLSDLLPEVQFHSHDRTRLTLALFAGIVAAYAIGLLEPGGGDHGHIESGPAVEHHQH